MEETIEYLSNKLKESGVKILSDSKKVNRASSCANTYIFKKSGKNYVVDSGFGKKRREDIKKNIINDYQVNILCSHYHNDHSANNGIVAKKDSIVFFHENIKDKIDYLRTNGTGQIIEMARSMSLKGMLKRFKMFPSWVTIGLVFLSKISFVFPRFFLFIVSYLYSLKNIGFIFSGKSKAYYLGMDNIKEIKLDGYSLMGWEIDKDLYAFHCPGHTDDHTIFYLKDKKTVFAGDSLNFLNANDIQFGDLKEVDHAIESIYELAKNEKIEILCQGHYYPVFGNDKILNYIKDIKDKHDHVFERVKKVIESFDDSFKFDDALKELKKDDSEILKGLFKITFPRSTLVFLDVYLLKALNELGFEKNNEKWEKPAV